MTSKMTDITATFPAACIPALAAWQGTDSFDFPHPNRDFSGALIESHPILDRHVRIVAMDGSNVLVLGVQGSCAGGPFAFNLPPELVELCREKPPLLGWADGATVAVPLPEWQQPGTVMLLGSKHEPDPRGMTSLSAYVGPKKAIPDYIDLSLGAVSIGFNDSISFRGVLAEVDRGHDEASDVIDRPIAPIAFEKLAALRPLGMKATKVQQIESGHRWDFQDWCWAATAFLSTEGEDG